MGSDEKEPGRGPIIRFRILESDSGARIPEYAHPGDAGFDIFTIEERVLRPGERYSFSTGLASEFPQGFVVLFWDRGGWALKHGLHVLAGVVDAGYRGEWRVVLVNLGQERIEIKPGDKIAQGLLMPVARATIEEVTELSLSERGERGFGSSGR